MAETRAANRPEPRFAELTAQDRLALTTAITAVFTTYGYRQTTVEDLRAQIDPKPFSALFTDKEDCFLAAYDELLGEARRLVSASMPVAGTWPERLAAALSTALELIDVNPASARLVLVQAQSATPTVFAHYLASIKALAPSIGEGRVFSAPDIPPPILDSTLPLGIAYMLGVHLTKQPEQPVADLCPELLRLLLLPYLGDRRTADFIGRRARRTANKRAEISPQSHGN